MDNLPADLVIRFEDQEKLNKFILWLIYEGEYQFNVNNRFDELYYEFHQPDDQSFVEVNTLPVSEMQATDI